jgi:ribulose-5-phosphate 4-epimerase/fuculose-1-phosphate aldolase
MQDDGYVKYKAFWKSNNNPNKEIVKDLEIWRSQMLKLNLIGMYKESGIGFGNISRLGDNGIIVSATATGGLKKLLPKHYPEVIKYNFEKNSVDYLGDKNSPPSSEAMTHAAVYKSDNNIKAVIHVHHLGMWKQLINKIPTTDKNATYGTPEMAYEIERLFKETNVRNKNILVMGGHEEGIITFGKNLDEAGNIMLQYFNKLKQI